MKDEGRREECVRCLRLTDITEWKDGIHAMLCYLISARQTDRQTSRITVEKETETEQNRGLTAHTPTTLRTRDTPHPPTAHATPHRAARSSYALTLSSIPTRRH